MAIFDDKQRKELKKGAQHCQSCAQYLDALRKMGTPNEVLEGQNEANGKIIQAALDLDEQHSKQPK